MSKNLKKKKRSIASTVIIVSLIILSIPTALVAYTGIKSLMGRGKPVLGSRFANDLDPQIKKKDVEELHKELTAAYPEMKIEVNLATGTLRVYAIDANLTKDSLQTLEKGVYDLVTSKLSVEDYFTKVGEEKHYDLEIHVTNMIKVSEEEQANHIYGMYYKTSSMTEPQSQLLSEPLSQDVVDLFNERQEYLDSEPEDIEEEEYDDNVGEGEE